MQNEMILNLSRKEVLDIRMALLAVLHGARHEYNNPETTPDRREILTATIEKWENLRKKVIFQFDMQDA